MKKQIISPSKEIKPIVIMVLIVLLSSTFMTTAGAQPQPRDVTATGDGLLAEYFNLDGTPYLFNGQPLVVNGEGPLDHRWEIFCQAANLETYYQGVCARWAGAFSANGTRFREILTGYIEAPQTGTYVFYGNIDDFIEITLLGQTYTFDILGGGGYTISSLNLNAGELYPIRITFLNRRGVARLNLYWTLPDGTSQVVPRKYLYTRIPNQPPVADAGGPYTGPEGSPVILDASSSTDLDNNIVEYAWDLDNDNVYEATGITAQVTYNDNGAFQVGLKVTDVYGETSTDIAEVIIANVLPVVDTLNIPDSVNAGDSFSVNADFSDPGLDDTFTAVWDWGNGETSAGILSNRAVTGSYAYSSAGNYTVTLTITDDDGGEGSQSASITVIQPIVYADAGPDRSAAEGEVTSLDASGSYDPTGGALTFVWDFNNDGLYDDASGVTPSLSFADDGNYLVGLLVTNLTGASATDTVWITVNNVAPVAQLSGAVVDASGNFSALGSFSDSGDDVWAGAVDYGDGSGIQPLALNPGKTFSLAHTYQLAGTFTVEVCISDDDGGTGCAQAQVNYSQNRPPVADPGGPYSVREGRIIWLNASKSSDPDIDLNLTYEWDLDGDGDFDDDSGKMIEFYGKDDAVLTVWLKVTDSQGLSSIASTTVTITNVPPYIVYRYINKHARVGVPITPWFIFRDQGPFDTFSAVWDWGDGTKSESTIKGYFAIGKHTYTRPGRYKITITLYDDDGGSAILNRWVIVHKGWR